MTRLPDQAALDDATAQLAAMDPGLAPILVAPLPLRQKPQGFTALLDIIVGQQVSTASAAAIWTRLEAAGLTGEPKVAAAAPEELIACGLSRPKTRYALAIAQAGVDWAGLAAQDDDTARATLLALPGIGPWSAEIYLLSALGRADAWPAGDLALQEAARVALNLPARPGAAEMDALAEPWRPLRSVAARALWSYYRVIKQRDGIR